MRNGCLVAMLDQVAQPSGMGGRLRDRSQGPRDVGDREGELEQRFWGKEKQSRTIVGRRPAPMHARIRSLWPDGAETPGDWIAGQHDCAADRAHRAGLRSASTSPSSMVPRPTEDQPQPRGMMAHQGHFFPRGPAGQAVKGVFGTAAGIRLTDGPRMKV